MISRRGFLTGIIAACAAPAIVKAGIIMPIKPLIVRPTAADLERLNDHAMDAIRYLLQENRRINLQLHNDVMLYGNAFYRFSMTDVVPVLERMDPRKVWADPNLAKGFSRSVYSDPNAKYGFSIAKTFLPPERA